MDKEKVIKKIKQGAPATSAIVVAACIGVSLSGYAVSGATCTSKAILDACENALLSAKRQ